MREVEDKIPRGLGSDVDFSLPFARALSRRTCFTIRMQKKKKSALSRDRREKDMRKAMNATSVKVRTFFWGVWGMSELNASSSFYLAPAPTLTDFPSLPLPQDHCMMSALKIYALHSGDLTLLKILSVQTVVCLAYLVLCGKSCLAAKADVSGFRNVFVLEAAAITFLAWSPVVA